MLPDDRRVIRDVGVESRIRYDDFEVSCGPMLPLLYHQPRSPPPLPKNKLEVERLGFGVQGVGFRIHGVGCRV